MEEKINICKHEVNFITEETKDRYNIVEEIRHEFDFINFCQAIMVPYGVEARARLDRFIALSMRKLLLDKYPLILILCPNFKMPPLTGRQFTCQGDENNDIRLNSIWPFMHVRKQIEWIPFCEWKEQRIAWINKTEKDVPLVLSDKFYKKILDATGNNQMIVNCYVQESVKQNEEESMVWKMIEPETNQIKVYKLLKEAGYYDLTIKTMIKHIADKEAAHADIGSSTWVKSANSSEDYHHSAISVFATQMIYATTKQIEALKNYWQIERLMETL